MTADLPKIMPLDVEKAMALHPELYNTYLDQEERRLVLQRRVVKELAHKVEAKQGLPVSQPTSRRKDLFEALHAPDKTARKAATESKAAIRKPSTSPPRKSRRDMLADVRAMVIRNTSSSASATQ